MLLAWFRVHIKSWCDAFWFPIGRYVRTHALHTILVTTCHQINIQHLQKGAVLREDGIARLGTFSVARVATLHNVVMPSQRAPSCTEPWYQGRISNYILYQEPISGVFGSFQHLVCFLKLKEHVFCITVWQCQEKKKTNQNYFFNTARSHVPGEQLRANYAQITHTQCEAQIKWIHPFSHSRGGDILNRWRRTL